MSEAATTSCAPPSQAVEGAEHGAASDARKPHLVIEPAEGWRSLRLRDMWEFRDLLLTLGMRDVKLIYKQTLLGVAWATILNVVRISLIAILLANFGIDWSAGTSHELLSLVLFAAAFGALLSTDQLLLAWITPVSERWEDWAGQPMSYGAGFARFWDILIARQPGSGEQVPQQEEPARAPVAKQSVSHMQWASLTGGIAFLCLAALQWAIWPKDLLAEGAAGRAPDSNLALELNEASMPNELGEAVLVAHRLEERDTEHLFGQYSKVYEYRDADAHPVTVSCDFAFPGEWHELTVCYRMMGWKMVSRDIIELPDAQSGDPWPAVEARFQRPDGMHAAVLFCEFGDRGEPLHPPKKTLVERISNALSRRTAKENYGDVYQVQVLLVNSIPLGEESLSQGRLWLAEARQILREKIVLGR